MVAEFLNLPAPSIKRKRATRIENQNPQTISTRKISENVSATPQPHI